MSWKIAVAFAFLCALGFVGSFTHAEEEKAALADNPYYKRWAVFKVGSTVTTVEKETLSGPDKKLAPDGVVTKEFVYKLLKVTPTEVVVEVVETEYDFLSTIEQSPAKITYPAKVSKESLVRLTEAIDLKSTDETVKVLGKELKVKLLTGTAKEESETIDLKRWVSDAVPGGIVKQLRTRTLDGKVTTEHKIEVKAYNKAD
jgi:hypothetical protein